MATRLQEVKDERDRADRTASLYTLALHDVLTHKIAATVRFSTPDWRYILQLTRRHSNPIVVQVQTERKGKTRHTFAGYYFEYLSQVRQWHPDVDGKYELTAALERLWLQAYPDPKHGSQNPPQPMETTS